ncbi:MAG: ABC transporter ATP-binding protein [Spirochaetales bacterium]|nr:ABC transporter ATP-binding protein [Spirochaetales bacterium]
MRIENLSFSFGQKQILKDFNASSDSRIVCIMGPSGCGKTTLLRILAGLLQKDSGTITDFPENRAMMFQEDRLLSHLNARGNVELVLDGTEEQNALTSRSILRRLGLDPEADISTMSGGMRRRVALARALAFKADALLLDEPFKGLDQDLMERCASIIRETGKPAVVSTHSEAEAQALGAEIIRLS